MLYYYINSASEQVGPADMEQLKKNGVTRDTLVWKEGMKDWIPAGKVQELQLLFVATPPPITKNPIAPPPLPAHQPITTGAPLNRNLKKFLIPAAVVACLIIIGALIFFRSGGSKTDDNKLGRADSILIAQLDTITEEKTENADTAKLVDLDTLANNLNWDTAKVVTTEPNDKTSSILPGFGGDPSPASKKNKKPVVKKIPKYTPGQQNDRGPERQTAPGIEPEKINPVKYLSITGSFRKNILFEAILEGTIQSRYSGQISDIVVEVRFLDASGQSIGTKRFTQYGPLAGRASIPFKFKTMPPKGTKGATFEIVRAGL